MAIVELVMPKMGESIIEATIIEWLKKEGDHVGADEIVLEIATDKVDSEIPANVSGTITKILHQKDAVVAVGAPLALIETEGNESAAKAPKVEAPAAPAPSAPMEAKQLAKVEETAKSSSKSMSLSRRSVAGKIPSNIDGRFFSPLVRNIARSEGISADELMSLEGSGADGRVTKVDLFNYIDDKKLGRVAERPAPRAQASNIVREAVQLKEEKAAPASAPQRPIHTAQSAPQSPPSTGSSSDEIIELSRMRKVIAGHMMNSLNTSAHVTSFVEADTTKLVLWRNKVKNEYQAKYGEKLTFSPLFTEAVIQALKDFPMINGSLQDDKLIVKKNINIGIATAMENGNLIVPVIRNSENLNLLGLTKQLNDITKRARVNNLRPDEIQGGTFTISNIGTFGNIMGTPIINQPQLAILALGAIKKKPVIEETPEGDIIAIRHMMFLSLSFDHRVIDGYQGGVFLNRIAANIENFDANRTI